MLEDPGLPEAVWERVHRDITRVHRVLGDDIAILRALRRDPLPVRRVIDIGCGRGALLAKIRRALGVDAIGVELRLPAQPAPVPILQADAVSDRLPNCDVALCVFLAHHLDEDEVVRLIRNVGRSARRLILVDLVRHRLPLALFRAFLGPFLHPVASTDGATSIRRAFTPGEMHRLARRALEGSAATYRHTVAPLYARQTLDISFVGS
jgi:SAM-dependent methyltransferase